MNKTAKEWVSVIVGVVSFVISFALVQAYPAAFGALIVFFVCSGFGYWLGSWYAKSAKRNEKFLKFLFWSNVATWLVPAIGFVTSVATYRINTQNNGKDRRQFMIFAGVCFVLSVANAIAGVLKLLG